MGLRAQKAILVGLGQNRGCTAVLGGLARGLGVKGQNGVRGDNSREWLDDTNEWGNKVPER